MPLLESQVIALLASVATILTQAFKNVIPEAGREWIPVGLLFLLTLVGVGLAMYYGRDPVAGVLEGFFAGGTALGFYAGASTVPGANKVFNGRGWVGQRK